MPCWQGVTLAFATLLAILSLPLLAASSATRDRVYAYSLLGAAVLMLASFAASVFVVITTRFQIQSLVLAPLTRGYWMPLLGLSGLLAAALVVLRAADRD